MEARSDWQDVYDSISQFLTESVSPDKTCWIAFSGGLDSSVLLHAICRTKSGKPDKFPLIRALHINHGLSPNSEKWAIHCEQQANRLDIPIDVVDVDVCKRGAGIEAAARHARYQVFEAKLSKGDWLLQGHHLNDQVETVLFRLFRGHGIAGLAGIPEQRSLGQGQLFRPLLNVTRSRLLQIATAWGISWIEDESNDDQTLDRNYIRHRIMPPLLDRWPSALKRIGKAVQWMGEARELQASLAELDLVKVKCGENSLDAKAFNELPTLRQKNLLRHWLQKQRLSLAERHLDDLLAVIRTGKAQSSQMDFGNSMALCISPQLVTSLDLKTLLAARKKLTWKGPVAELVSLGHTPLGLLQLVFVEHNPGGAALLRAPQKNEVISVRYREGGEKFRPVGRQGSCTLKKWLNEAGVPAWKRSLLPIVLYDNCIVAIADMVVDEAFMVRGNGFRVQIRTDS